MKFEINDKIINACKLNRPLLDMLCPKRSGRYTKLEAYIDLLDRISTQKSEDVHTGEVVSVAPGEFAVTITELSEKWNWHRATVRTFLESLEEIGEIRKEIQKHCYKVSMTNQVKMFIPIDTPDDMLDYCRILFTHLSMRLRSMKELVPFAEQYCSLSAESEGDNRRYWSDEAYVIRVVHALIVSSFTATRHCGEIVLNADVESNMLETLRGDSPWSIYKWLQAASLIGIALDEQAKPALHMDMHGVFSESDLPLLGKLYDYYQSEFFNLVKQQKTSSAEHCGSSNPKAENLNR